MFTATIPAFDALTFGVGLIGVLYGWLASRNRLPRWARRWLSRIGKEKIEEFIAEAAYLSGTTPLARREWAVAKLQEWTEKQLVIRIPTSIANLLVEFVYQQWKRAR